MLEGPFSFFVYIRVPASVVEHRIPPCLLLKPTLSIIVATMNAFSPQMYSSFLSHRGALVTDCSQHQLGDHPRDDASL